MATAARTAAGFGAFVSTCSVRPTGCRSASSSQPQTHPNASSPQNCLSASSKHGQVVIGDKGFAGADFEQHVAALGGTLLRPDRRDEAPRFGSLGRIRQWIESTFDTLKGQLSLERHGGRTLTGLVSRIARRLLALTATILHNWQIGNPGRTTHRLRPLRNQSSSRLLGITHCESGRARMGRRPPGLTIEAPTAGGRHTTVIAHPETPHAGARPRPPLIRLERVEKTYRMGKLEYAALRGVDLDVEAGELVAVVGPSGSGKTTILNLITGSTGPRPAASPSTATGSTR